MTNETLVPCSESNEPEWYLIDCKGEKLGRVATYVAGLLCGKTKPNYYPAFNTGDNVILVNVGQILFGRTAPYTYTHVYTPGNNGTRKYFVTLPILIVRRAIMAMLPKGYAKRNPLKRLKIYVDAKQLHAAQSPRKLSRENRIKITTIEL